MCSFLSFPPFEFPSPTLSTIHPIQLSLRIDRRALSYLSHQPSLTEYLPTNHQGPKLIIRQQSSRNLPTTYASTICSCARTILYTPLPRLLSPSSPTCPIFPFRQPSSSLTSGSSTPLPFVRYLHPCLYLYL